MNSISPYEMGNFNAFLTPADIFKIKLKKKTTTFQEHHQWQRDKCLTFLPWKKAEGGRFSHNHKLWVGVRA